MPDWLNWFSERFADLPGLGLFLYSFLAATLLPGGSELALFAYVQQFPQALATALLLATVGNTLGGMTSYACGRFLPTRQRIEQFRHLHHVERYGAPILLLSWVPLVGDLFCVAAGWLRVHWAAALLYMAIGKLARYWFVAKGALLFT